MLFTSAIAQQQGTTIQPATKLDYKFFLYGQTVAIGMTVKSVTDSVQLDWNLRGMAFGSYLVSKKGFENGTKLNFIQPAASTVLRLAPDETFAVISKAAFRALKKDKKFIYNNTTYVLQSSRNQPVFKAGDRELDVLHVVGVEEHGELWILNDPDFPLICQVKNNPVGINFTITAIK
ncbi:MAG: hypothetical protein ABWY16_17570 [Pedobacter sp.]|uniref:hypothetical protein n=1 Tax=Pedobacter sp. TaxID=1411316 RepID=UPI00339A14ED